MLPAQEPTRRAMNFDVLEVSRGHATAMRNLRMDFQARLKILAIDPQAPALYESKVEELGGRDARQLAVDLMRMVSFAVETTMSIPQCQSPARTSPMPFVTVVPDVVHATTNSNTTTTTTTNACNLVFRPKRTNSIDSCSSHVIHRKMSVTNTTSCERGVDSEGFKIINDYTILQHLGQGASGKVKLAVHHPTNEVRAIKIVRRSMIKKLQGLHGLDRLKMEVAIMKKLRHRSIVTLHEVIDDPDSDKVYFAMQHIEHGPIMKEPDEEGFAEPLPPNNVQVYIRQVLSALIYLHNHGVAHLDIKPQNILLGTEDRVYLVDFGISELMLEVDNNNVRCTGMGTPAYMAPEVCRGDEFVDGEAVDAWSVGVTTFFMLYGHLPFRGRTVREMHASISSMSGALLEFPESATEDEKSFISSLVVRDPSQRSKLLDLRQHPFMQCASVLGGSLVESPRHERSSAERRASVNDFVSQKEVDNALTVLTYTNGTNPSASSRSSPISGSRSARTSFQMSPTAMSLEALPPPPPPPLSESRVRNPRQQNFQENHPADEDVSYSSSAVRGGSVGTGHVSIRSEESTASFMDAPDSFRQRRATQKVEDPISD